MFSPHTLPHALSLQEVLASGFHTLSPRKVPGLLHCACDAVHVCTLWFPRKVEPGIASQLLIGNQFPSVFRCTAPGRDSGLQNWCQNPTYRKQKSFCLTKKNAPEAGCSEEEQGRAFPRLYHGKGSTLGVNKQPFVCFPYNFCRFFE